jgi:hypothetical protein
MLRSISTCLESRGFLARQLTPKRQPSTIRRHFFKLLRWTLPLVAGFGAECFAAAQPVPDFHLPDVNTNSVRFNSSVSPRDYVLQVSGYYFGAAH